MRKLVDIRTVNGPPVIRNENGSLAGWAYVDMTGRDIGGYAEEAKKLVLPLTLLLIFILLYVNFRSIPETFIILLSIPFAMTGSIWLLWLLDYYSEY